MMIVRSPPSDNIFIPQVIHILMTRSEAQKRYMDKRPTVSFTMPKEEYEQLLKAKKEGETVSSMVYGAVRDRYVKKQIFVAMGTCRICKGPMHFNIEDPMVKEWIEEVLAKSNFSHPSCKQMSEISAPRNQSGSIDEHIGSCTTIVVRSDHRCGASAERTIMLLLSPTDLLSQLPCTG